MWMLPVMEARDKALIAPRLRRAYEAATTEEERNSLGINVEFLPTVYKSLTKMDQFAFTFSMQAQLATDLVADPAFNANEEQIIALKQGTCVNTKDSTRAMIRLLTEHYCFRPWSEDAFARVLGTCGRDDFRYDGRR
jgi:hypothetical protein